MRLRGKAGQISSGRRCAYDRCSVDLGSAWQRTKNYGQLRSTRGQVELVPEIRTGC